MKCNITKKDKLLLKILSLFLMITILLTMHGICVYASSITENVNFNNSILIKSLFSNGNGTVENPYEIETAEQLNYIRNDLTANYVLSNDIDLSNYDSWIPIGDEEHKFEGMLDGQGYIISNLTINTATIYETEYSNSTAYVGLFASASGAISNLNLQNINFDINDIGGINYFYIGGISGIGSSSIVNCSVNGNIKVSALCNGHIGGIVGSGDATNCTNYTNIDVKSDASYVYCGGISGYAKNISNCVNYGYVHAVAQDYLYCGGIIGEENGKIEYCRNFGDVFGEIGSGYSGTYSSFAGNCNVGGLVGAVLSGTLTCNANYGNVKGYVQSGSKWLASCYVGGLIGYSWGNAEKCYNLGETITSIRQRINNGEYIEIEGEVGRIEGYGYRWNECYSLNTTTINGIIPTEITSDTEKNGLSESKSIIESFIIDNLPNNYRIALLKLDSAIKENNELEILGMIKFPNDEPSSPELITERIESIVWTDKYGIVQDNSIHCTIKEIYDNRTAYFTINFISQKKGIALITGTASNGLTSSCNIAVEAVKDNDIKKHVISLSPKQNYQYEDLSDVRCTIKFDKEVKNIKNGIASLIEYNTDKVIEKINLKESIKNSDNKVVLSANAITIIFNIQWEEQTLLFPNTKYYILIEGSTIELDGGYLLTGIDEKNYWNFTTIPIEHSLIKNSKADDEKIELSKYMTFFKPLTALHIRERDDGTNGLCFGISYATGAWNNSYSGIRSIGKDVNSLMDMKLSTRGDLQYTFWEYLQLAQIAQYTSEMDSILKNNEVNEKKTDKIQDFYNAVKNFQNNTGDMVIFGAFNHEKIGHAIVPVGISYEDDDVAIIKVYNCNGEGENLFNNKFIYDLTLKKENGKFVDWDFLSFNNKDGKKGYFRFCTVDEVIDMAVRIANSEKKELANLIFSDSELGGLEEIGSCTSRLTDKLTQHLYWINDTSIMRQVSDNDNPSEIGITDGEKEISAVMPLDTKVKLDLDSEFINASLSKISDYSLSFVSSDIDNTILSLVINGRTGGEVLAEQTKNGIVLKADNLSNTEIVIKDGDRSNKLIFSSEKKCVLINATDEKVAVSEDSNGDGQYDNEIASMEIIKVYTIDYILNGGNVSGNPMSYMADTLPITLKNPTKNGYAFTGWTGSNGNIPQILVTITEGTTGKLNYTANWEKITFLPSPSPSPSNNGIGNNSGSGGVSGGGGSTGSGGVLTTPTSTPVVTLTPSPSPTHVTIATIEPTPKPSASTKPGTGSDSISNNNSKKEITPADVTLNKKTIIYSGKEKKPGVTVLSGSLELIKDKEYTVSYSYNINVGTAYVTVYGKGDYYGSVTKSFKIIPKGTPLKGKVKPRHKGFSVKWKKQPKSITGYQVQYSTDKKFKGKTTVIRTVKKKSVTKLTISKLKAKKKYYVRVRTYKTVKGKKYYSRWSKSKVVKTKK